MKWTWGFWFLFFYSCKSVLIGMKNLVLVILMWFGLIIQVSTRRLNCVGMPIEKVLEHESVFILDEYQLLLIINLTYPKRRPFWRPFRWPFDDSWILIGCKLAPSQSQTHLQSLPNTQHQSTSSHQEFCTQFLYCKLI